MVVWISVRVTHYPQLNVEGKSIVVSQRVEHVCPLRVGHRVAIGGIQPDRRWVTCRAIGYQPLRGSVRQVTVRIVSAISLRQEVNVVIKVIFEACERLGWDATGIGPIAKIGRPGK